MSAPSFAGPGAADEFVAADDALDRTRAQRDASDIRNPFVRQPSEGYLGRHRLVPGDDTPTMPQDTWFRPQDDGSESATRYLPRVGTLDDESINPPGGADRERAAAAQAIRGSATPDPTLFQRILDGLRRL